jgi:hypothetical protein
MIDATDREVGILGVGHWQQVRYASPGEFLQEYLDVEEPSQSRKRTSAAG